MRLSFQGKSLDSEAGGKPQSFSGPLRVDISPLLAFAERVCLRFASWANLCCLFGFTCMVSPSSVPVWNHGRIMESCSSWCTRAPPGAEGISHDYPCAYNARPT